MMAWTATMASLIFVCSSLSSSMCSNRRIWAASLRTASPVSKPRICFSKATGKPFKTKQDHLVKGHFAHLKLGCLVRTSWFTLWWASSPATQERALFKCTRDIKAHPAFYTRPMQKHLMWLRKKGWQLSKCCANQITNEATKYANVSKT